MYIYTTKIKIDDYWEFTLEEKLSGRLCEMTETSNLIKYTLQRTGDKFIESQVMQKLFEVFYDSSYFGHGSRQLLSYQCKVYEIYINYNEVVSLV